MKYLCLGYFDPQRMDAKPKAEIDALLQQCGPHLERLYQTGCVLADIGVAVETRRVQRRAGTLHAGPPDAASGPQVGSAFLIEADSLEDAVRLASQHPAAQIAAGEALGWYIDVRPVHYFHGPLVR